MAKCIQCQKDGIREGRKYCSRKCFSESSKRKETRTCKQCGIEFSRRPSDFRIGKEAGNYCSQKCSHKAQIGKEIPSLRIQPIEYMCPVCSKTFLAGGRGRAPRDQVFCSDECKRMGRYRRGKVANQLSIVEAAYLAGFVDGEGSIMILARKGTISIRTSITNTDHDVLDWIWKTVGVGDLHLARFSTEKWKTTWTWNTNGDSTESILTQILPYLRIKKVQAELAIETMNRLRDPVYKADRTWQVEWYERMHALNKRGPALIAQT